MKTFFVILMILLSISSHGESIGYIPVETLRDKNLSIIIENDFMSTSIYRGDKKLISLSVDPDLYCVTTYVECPDTLKALNCYNEPIRFMIDNQYCRIDKYFYNIYDLRRSSFHNVDSLAIVWERTADEILDYKMLTYDVISGQFEGSRTFVDPDNCFDWDLDGPEIEYQSIPQQPDSLRLQTLGYDKMTHRMKMPSIQQDLQYLFRYKTFDVGYDIEDQFIYLKIRKDDDSIFVKYDSMKNIVVMSCFDTRYYRSITYFSNGKMKSNYIGMDVSYEKINDYIRSLPSEYQHMARGYYNSLVIERKYNIDNRLQRQIYYFNRSSFDDAEYIWNEYE